MKASLFRKAGVALFGDEWVGPMAVALDVNMRTVQRWATGRQEIPDGVRQELLAMCQEMKGDLASIAEELATGEENNA